MDWYVQTNGTWQDLVSGNYILDGDGNPGTPTDGDTIHLNGFAVNTVGASYTVPGLTWMDSSPGGVSFGGGTYYSGNTTLDFSGSLTVTFDLTYGGATFSGILSFVGSATINSYGGGTIAATQLYVGVGVGSPIITLGSNTGIQVASPSWFHVGNVDGSSTFGTLIIPGGSRLSVDGGLTWINGPLIVGAPPAYPPTSAVLTGYSTFGGAGTVTLPSAIYVLSGISYGASGSMSGTYAQVATGNVRQGITFGPGGGYTGSCYVPAAADVRHGTLVDATSGTAYIPGAAYVLLGVNVDNTVGTVRLPGTGVVQNGYAYGASDSLTGTLVGGLTLSDLQGELNTRNVDATHLGRLDQNVSSRLATTSYTTPPTVAQIATQVEIQIMDDTDGHAVKQALVDKINSVDADLSGLSIAAITSAVAAQITSDHGSGSYVRNTEPDNTTIGTINTALGNIASGTTKVTPVDADGLSFVSAQELAIAFYSGLTTLTDNGNGSHSVTFKKRNGTSTKSVVTYRDDTKERTASSVS